MTMTSILLYSEIDVREVFDLEVQMTPPVTVEEIYKANSALHVSVGI